jgi:hypothetical protein
MKNWVFTNISLSQAWQLTLGIPTFRRWRQETQEFEASLGYVAKKKTSLNIEI